MELIIEEIVDEICFLVSINSLTQDVHLEDLMRRFFEYPTL